MTYKLNRARMGAYCLPAGFDINDDHLLFWNNLFLTPEIEYNISGNIVIIPAAEKMGMPNDLVTLVVLPNYKKELERLHEYDKSAEWYKQVTTQDCVIKPIDKPTRGRKKKVSEEESHKK
jgi:hypothetical protein